jgi:isopenicillin N synthase-like dioxygenase
MDAPKSLSEAEKQARRVEEEANNWDIPTLDRLESPSDGELPIIDIATLHSNNPTAINDVARQLSHIFKNTGFFLLSNHGYETVVAETLEAAERFHHTLTQEEKDRISFGEKGVGYIKMNQKILPKRKKGNMNETFIVKRELGPRNITLESNPFPEESKLPGFKDQVLKYANCMEKLALTLVPSIAVALDLESNYFDAAFTQPLFRLRLSHYPPANLESSQYGIAPHTDTSFFTLLAQVKYRYF